MTMIMKMGSSPRVLVPTINKEEGYYSASCINIVESPRSHPIEAIRVFQKQFFDTSKGREEPVIRVTKKTDATSNPYRSLSDISEEDVREAIISCAGPLIELCQEDLSHWESMRSMIPSYWEIQNMDRESGLYMLKATYTTPIEDIGELQYSIELRQPPTEVFSARALIVIKSVSPLLQIHEDEMEGIALPEGGVVLSYGTGTLDSKAAFLVLLYRILEASREKLLYLLNLPILRASDVMASSSSVVETTSIGENNE